MTATETTTRLSLVRFRAGLLVLTGVVLASSLWIFVSVWTTAGTVRDRTAQAILEVAAARSALVAADRAAITSFRSGEATLAGPGQEYANAITQASQSLARVAELNQAGDAGTSSLQVVEGLLAAYSGSVGQADAHFRQADSAVLGAADLWYASRLLHAPGGVLVELESLQGLQRQALADQISWDGMGPWWIGVWLVPPVLLLAVLGWTQHYLRKQFRRVLNAPLLGATALAVGVGFAMLLTFFMHRRLEDVSSQVDVTISGWEARISTEDALGQRDLAALVRQRCGRDGGCGNTVDTFTAGLRQDVTPAPDQKTLTAEVKAVNDAATGAAESGGLEFLIPAAGLAVGLLILFGLHARIDEYRYQA
ncbi:hypothetical protein [Amycolatopsis sp. H20-H5]|uniref:hypothetical protein n=1 Tax=Amycolatopsis sp. H20-H5 TaxID=3046309 RepID=UPI002DBD2765|nr:hypothetical protein [Amycolatopsis sp. H20-H5]MEC3982647.1 hypothetical protein [Amycolatopsis sp. H20-H5]